MSPQDISPEELNQLKLACASAEDFPVDADNCFKRDSAEWLEMESLLKECAFAVFHFEKATMILLTIKEYPWTSQIWICDGEMAGENFKVLRTSVPEVLIDD